MGFLDFFSSKKKPGIAVAAPGDAQAAMKLKADNEQAYAGLQNLDRMIKASNQEDAVDAMRMEEYLNRLRQEGRGF